MGTLRDYAQGEWYLHHGNLDRDAYERMLHGFYPSKYDAREWARIVRKSGAKYITITARHHDGFALWPSKVDDYNIKSTPFKRDILGELAEACKTRKVKFAKPVKARYFRFVAPHALPVNDRLAVAEVDVM